MSGTDELERQPRPREPRSVQGWCKASCGHKSTSKHILLSFVVPRAALSAVSAQKEGVAVEVALGRAAQV